MARKRRKRKVDDKEFKKRRKRKSRRGYGYVKAKKAKKPKNPKKSKRAKKERIKGTKQIVPTEQQIKLKELRDKWLKEHKRFGSYKEMEVAKLTDEEYRLFRLKNLIRERRGKELVPIEKALHAKFMWNKHGQDYEKTLRYDVTKLAGLATYHETLNNLEWIVSNLRDLGLPVPVQLIEWLNQAKSGEENAPLFLWDDLEFYRQATYPTSPTAELNDEVQRIDFYMEMIENLTQSNKMANAIHSELMNDEFNIE